MCIRDHLGQLLRDAGIIFRSREIQFWDRLADLTLAFHESS